VTHPSLDVSVPNVSRMYDYMLGGRENFRADRDAVARLLMVHPGAAQTARDNRDFLRRVVRYLAERGIDQFLDIGSGLPTQENVHEVAHQVNPQAKVAYVDRDPVVVSHGVALLAKSKQVIMVSADFRQAEALLRLPAIQEHFDFSKPVAVLFLQVLHFVSDDDAPAGIVAAFKDALCSGSYLVIAQVTGDDVPDDVYAKTLTVYRRASDLWPRSKHQIGRFFDGFELLEPTLAPEYAWRPGPGGALDRQLPFCWAGVARKPLCATGGSRLTVHSAAFSPTTANKG
jgi:SAM-dependent methyltransferase